MSKTEKLNYLRNIPNEILDKDPTIVNHIAEDVHTTLGKMLADKVCDGRLYSVIMKPPKMTASDEQLRFNLTEYRRTIDVTPLVRCKECKYAHMTYGGECKYCDQWSPEDPLYLDGDFFCSFGEREDDE